MKRAHITVYGYVHGVSFRAYVQKEALRLDLNGWARNTPEGNVEIVAEGDEQSLKELVQWCHKGPQRARVEKVDVAYSHPSHEFSAFEIIY